jgi:hypothetical protein
MSIVLDETPIIRLCGSSGNIKGIAEALTRK